MRKTNKLAERNVSMSTPMSMLELRKIEAAILRDVYHIVLERHGSKEAKKIVTDAVSKSAIAQGKSLRDLLGQEPDLEDFADLIPLWEADGALDVEILRRGPDRLDFNIRRCRFSEMYQEMGLAEIGPLLSCNRDAKFCVGYNPDMELTRTQTIMEGADHCDFRYRMK